MSWTRGGSVASPRVFADKGIVTSPTATEAASLPRVMSPNNEGRLQLLPRIGSFVARGWINAMEERELLDLLEHTEYGDGITADGAATQVKRSLDFIERRRRGETRDSPSGGDDESGGDGDERDLAERPELSCCQFKDVNDPGDVSGRLSQPQMESLFVEMCFFARLGFLQPPSCLQCAYREGVSRTGQPAEDGCTRPVIWRKDANIPLHPDSLAANTVIVTCRASRAWMSGQSVDDLKWDKKSRCLLSSE